MLPPCRKLTVQPRRRASTAFLGSLYSQDLSNVCRADSRMGPPAVHFSAEHHFAAHTCLSSSGYAASTEETELQPWHGNKQTAEFRQSAQNALLPPVVGLLMEGLGRPGDRAAEGLARFPFDRFLISESSKGDQEGSSLARRETISLWLRMQLRIVHVPLGLLTQSNSWMSI